MGTPPRTCRDCPLPVPVLPEVRNESQPVLCLPCKRRIRRAAKKRRQARKPKGATPEKKELPLLVRVRQYVNSLKDFPCKDCGNCYHPVAMDFDHRPGEAKVKDVAKMKTFAAIDAEVTKCDLVCSNCHRVRTWVRLQS